MPEPVQIIEENDAEITIEWSDGKETRFNAVQLRRFCPCAACIDEWTGEKMLNDASIPEDLVLNQISIVGRYALNFHFSDGHDTGIFSFGLLRSLADQS